MDQIAALAALTADPAGRSPCVIRRMSATAWLLTGVDRRDRDGTAPLAASECYDGAQHIVLIPQPEMIST
jgi:hypothetical protein